MAGKKWSKEWQDTNKSKAYESAASLTSHLRSVKKRKNQGSISEKKTTKGIPDFTFD